MRKELDLIKICRNDIISMHYSKIQEVKMLRGIGIMGCPPPRRIQS